MIYILAGNGQQASEWQRENKLDSRTCRYIRDEYILRGVKGPIEIVKVGTWYERGDLKEIEEQLTLYGFVEAKLPIPETSQ